MQHATCFIFKKMKKMYGVIKVLVSVTIIQFTDIW